MNRPRNRQPRPSHAVSAAGGAGHSSHHHPRRPPTTGSASTALVPSTQHVVRGAAVSIVLKADQPTGREVQGIVQDLLTRGNHPRGIKVRLQDGRVGRVQRMIGGDGAAPNVGSDTSNNEAATHGRVSNAPPRRGDFRFVRDARYDDEFAEGPPPSRSLADFVPEMAHVDESVAPRSITTTTSVKCPICGEFEGDEIAVSRHVDSHFD